MEKQTINKHKVTGTLLKFLGMAIIAGAGILLSSCATYVIGVGAGSHHSGVGVSVAVPVRARNRHSSAAARKNRRVKRQIRDILAAYHFRTSGIRIKVDRGLVVLRGPVPSLVYERDIVRRVARLPGVHTVRSKMYVRTVY